MTLGPGRFSLGTGLSPTVYGWRMNEPHHVLILPLLLVSLVSVPPSLDGQDGQAYQVLYAASDRYYGVETLCARFDQMVELTLLRQTVSSEGMVCLRQPDHFSMRFADPEGDLVVVDGEFAWTFYPSQDDMQVMRFSVEGVGGGFNFFENLLEDPRGRFEAVHEGREPMGEGVSHKITLTPRKTPGLRPSGFRSAVVWFDVDGYLITAVDIHDTNESIRKLRLSDIKVGIDLPDELFRFVPPDGARVMTPPEGTRVIPG
jgi:outer membrane lipoprotein-sorting protein